MGEEWKTKGKLLQEVEALRNRIIRLEQDQDNKKEQPLEKSNGGFGTTFDKVSEGVLLIDLETKQSIAGNKAIYRMLGCQREGIENLRIEDVYCHKTSAQIFEEVERQPNGKPSLVHGFPIKKLHGGILFVDIILIPLTIVDKKYVMSIFREVPPEKSRGIRKRNISTNSSKSPHLTATEINILKLIINGLSSKEIAHFLHRSPRTVENHRAHLMKKLGVDNSVELVRRAVSLGLIDLPAEPQQERPV